MSDQILHLLIPKTFRVYCLPNRSAGVLGVTTAPSKATCANCLTGYQRKQGKHTAGFKVAHTPSTRPKLEFEDNSQRCAVCGGRIYLESPAEGYSCRTCGSSDSDE